MKDLREFLEAAELLQYYTSFRDSLKVTTVDHIKFIKDDDLLDIGLSKPEIRRLREYYSKERPSHSALDKLRKMNPTRLLPTKSDVVAKNKSSTLEISWPRLQTVTKSGASEASGLQEATASTLPTKFKVGRSESARTSSHPAVKRLTAFMIGRPETDVRHVGHVGRDGAIFGDVALYGNIVEQLPLKASAANGRHSTLTSSCISLPCTSNNECFSDKHYSKDDTAAQRSSIHSNDGDFTDFSIELDFGASLMDEVMKALGMKNGDKSLANNGSSSHTTQGRIARETSIPSPSPDDENNDSSDTEVGSDGSNDGSGTETETTDDFLPERRNAGASKTAKTVLQSRDSEQKEVISSAPKYAEMTSSSQRSSYNNIRVPRGVPGLDCRISVGTCPQTSTQRTAASSSLLSSASDTDEGKDVDTNPLRRLRQTRLALPS